MIRIEKDGAVVLCAPEQWPVMESAGWTKVKPKEKETKKSEPVPEPAEAAVEDDDDDLLGLDDSGTTRSKRRRG